MWDYTVGDLIHSQYSNNNSTDLNTLNCARTQQNGPQFSTVQHRPLSVIGQYVPRSIISELFYSLFIKTWLRNLLY